MKTIASAFLAIFALALQPFPTHAAEPVTTPSPRSAARSQLWKPQTPEGYLPITWVKARGIASYYRAPQGSAFGDYLTRIHLPYAEIKFISSAAPRTELGAGKEPLAGEGVRNWGFARAVVERLKLSRPDAKFIWDFPFFNMNLAVTEISLALKAADDGGEYVSSGARPDMDMEKARRVLIINNATGMAKVMDFDTEPFRAENEIVVEGFGPDTKVPGSATSTGRLFVGVRPGGTEVVVYCSRGATVAEASAALVAAGVPAENQVQGDGGGSTTCGYNLPGQYFVEPGRMLPHIMGAFSLKSRAVSNADDLRVRDAPHAEGKILRTLKRGTKLAIYEEKNGWVRISERQEWVSGQYARRIRM